MRVKALQGELVVAVAAGTSHTIAVTGIASLFGWGKAEALGLPEIAVTTIADHALGYVVSFPLSGAHL